MTNIKLSLLFVPFACLLIYVLPCCNGNAGEENVYIDNGKIKLGFSKQTGALTAFRDLVNSYDHLDDTIITGTPWQIELHNPSEISTLDIYGASEFHYSKPGPLTLVLEWNHFDHPESGNLNVTAVVSLDENKPLSSWKISVKGIKGIQISRVAFPLIAGIKNIGNEYLAVPVWMGQLMKDPRNNLAKSQGEVKKFEWSYPGQLSMQCLTLYDPEKCCFYASCNDSLGYKKNFSVSLDSLKRISYQINNFPARDSASTSYSPAYDAIIGSFKGDWITAAGLYREWGSKQKWCRESRFRNRLTPQWLEKTALWVWNRGKSPNVLVPARDMSLRLGLPVNVFWHWWHGCSYDDGFPEYIPPREGKESFVSAISSAHDNGIRAIVYMNQALWGTTTESWQSENAVLSSAKDPGGHTITHVFNIFTNKPAAYMCMATGFWKDKYSSLCDSAVNIYGTDGIYMDMACLSLMCYDRDHGHPVGGGNYWIEHFGILTNRIRSKILPEKQLVLAGEGCGEVWLPYLDAFLTLEVSKERYAGTGTWETIPFFQSVYHQFGITYGNYSSLIVPPYDELWPEEYAPKDPLKLLDKDFNKQFLMEQARSFVWGLQPTIANYQSFIASDRKEEIGYLLNLAKTRNNGLKYLLHGKFFRSPELASPEEELNLSRLSIYAGKKGNSVTTFWVYTR